MNRTIQNKFMNSFLAFAHVVFSVFVLVPNVSHAQDTDINPPMIQLEAVADGVQGEVQVFSATVTDDNEIASMTLFYRLGSDAEYTSMPMTIVAGTDIYTASVDTVDSSNTVIQYYMEAKDLGGNRTVQGFAFDPFERTLSSDGASASSTQAAAIPAANTATGGDSSTVRKVVYGLLAVAVVGGLVAASNKPSSGNATDAGEVELTIVVDKFQ